MDRRFLAVVALCVALPLAIVGCKGKAEKPAEEESMDISMTIPSQDELTVTQPVEPAAMVAAEAIPPTAQPPAVEKAAPVVQAVVTSAAEMAKDIQRALKNAGFYDGAIDGKIGPKTKAAIESFQKARGLTADGKVGPKTWAELSKHLGNTQQ